jgi:hypothetical protein
MSDHPDDGVSDGGTAISETELVVKAYAKVLETKPETIVSDTSLPFPKQAIKEALKAETLSARNANFSHVAGTCYRQLAGFRPKVEVLAWQNATAPEGKQAVERAWKEELNALILEWQTYLNEHDLA